MEKVIVTGALGFIGYHLCHFLLEEGVEVIGIDAMINPRRKAWQEEMLFSFGRNAQFLFVNENVTNINFSTMIEGADCIFHLANSGLENTLEHVEEEISKYLAVTKTIIEACKPTKTPIIYTSSFDVFGNGSDSITESSPTNPQTPLGYLKKADEELLIESSKRDHIPLIIVRMPTVYGPWQHEESLFHHFLLSQLKGEKYDDVEWNDNAEKHWIFVDDVVQALWKAAISDFSFEIYHLSSSENNQWERAYYWIFQKPIEKENMSYCDLSRNAVSSKKIEEKLHVMPSYSLEEGLQTQKEHLKKLLERNPSLFC